MMPSLFMAFRQSTFSVRWNFGVTTKSVPMKGATARNFCLLKMNDSSFSQSLIFPSSISDDTRAPPPTVTPKYGMSRPQSKRQSARIPPQPNFMVLPLFSCLRVDTYPSLPILKCFPRWNLIAPPMPKGIPSAW